MALVEDSFKDRSQCGTASTRAHLCKVAIHHTSNLWSLSLARGSCDTLDKHVSYEVKDQSIQNNFLLVDLMDPKRFTAILCYLQVVG